MEIDEDALHEEDEKQTALRAEHVMAAPQKLFENQLCFPSPSGQACDPTSY
jgi:hypothetical protein